MTMKIEYKVSDFKQPSAEDELNKLGQEGWELVSVLDLNTHMRCVMKRKLSLPPIELSLIG